MGQGKGIPHYPKGETFIGSREKMELLEPSIFRKAAVFSNHGADRVVEFFLLAKQKRTDNRKIVADR